MSVGSAGDCSDAGNGAVFAALHGERLRWHVHRRCWLEWDGQQWQTDPGRAVEAAAEATAEWLHQAARALPRPDDDDPHQDAVGKARRAAFAWARESRSQARLQAMIRRAQWRLAVTTQELDADAWILACRNGVLDLRSGHLSPPRPAQLTTRVAHVEWQPEARSEAWDNFLAEVTGGDQELCAWLQRAVGYSLLGEWREKAFWFAFGPPDGGKSTFLGILARVLGGYHTAADASTWMVQAAGGNRGDLVRLAGARLVTTSEIVPGSKFDTALMKRVAGGDPIVAAAKFEGEIEFAANFSLWLAGNDRPQIALGDEGLWRRLQCVPFTHVVPRERQDRTLAAKLASGVHASAVLKWAWDGLQAYLSAGLGSCAAVDAANAGYRADMNPLQLFAEECLTITGDASHQVSWRTLQAEYAQWCEENRIRAPLHPRTFSRALQDLGAEPARTERARMWTKIKLRL